MSNFVPGVGNKNAKLLILGEAPGRSEDQEGIPFCGPSGELLWNTCAELGIYRQEVWATNVYKYQPPFNDIKRIKEVCDPVMERTKLAIEIEDINPNVILALGGTAFEAVSNNKGILKWRGSILRDSSGSRKLVGSIHPSVLVRASRNEAGETAKFGQIWKHILKADISRAIEESRTNTYDIPFTHVQICRDSSHLSRFLDANRNRKKMAMDIESINCIPVCISIAFDEVEAFVIPLFNTINGIKLTGIPLSDITFIWQKVNDLIKEKDIIGQNFKYDQDKLQMLGFSFKRGRPIFSDTLLKAHTIIAELPSKRMEMLQSLWTRMPYHKDEGKEFNLKKDKIERLFHYGGLDAISTFATDASMEGDLVSMSARYSVDLVGFYYNYVMQLHEVYLDMESVGFKVDDKTRASLKIKYQTQHDLIQARLKDALPEFSVKGLRCHPEHNVNVASPPQIKELLYTHLALPKRLMRGKLKADEDTIVALRNNHVIQGSAKDYVLSDILEDRRVRKTLGTYILAKTDFDGRIRGSYRITGTETSRSSTAILKQPLRPIKIGHAFQTLTKHGDIGADIRELYVPDEGFCFVGIDLSQAEPRIVAELSNDAPLLEAFRSGKVDIHRRTAALILGMVQNLNLNEAFDETADKLGKDSPERFMGKKVRNGGNYDMGKGELAINIATDAKRFGIDIPIISEYKANKMLESFHRESPNIRGVFHKEIQEALHYGRVLINPYGRVRNFYDFMGKQLYGEAYAHIPQSTVADTVKNAILSTKIEMKDMPRMLLGEAHDALLFQFPINEWEDRARIVVKYLTRPIDFSMCTLKRGSLVIPTDVECSFTNYKEMKKVKL